MIGATRFMQPGVFAVTRRFGDLQKVIMICMSNEEGCSTQQDREHDEAHRRAQGTGCRAARPGPKGASKRNVSIESPLISFGS